MNIHSWLPAQEEFLIEVSNLMQEKFSDNPNFSKADSYLTNKIQQKLGEAAGFEDETEYIIETVCSYLGVKVDEFFKILEE